MRPLMKALVSLDNYQPYRNFGKGIEIVHHTPEEQGVLVLKALCPECGLENVDYFMSGGPMDRPSEAHHIVCKKCDHRYDAVQEGR
jgi:hypothetical protein